MEYKKDMQKIMELYPKTRHRYIKTRYLFCPFEDIENLAPKKGKILDIGCGYGMLSNLLAIKQPKRIVKGVDLSEKRIIGAKETIKTRKNISFTVGDVNDLKLGAYDAIVMSDFFHHLSVSEQDKILKKIYSSLKKKKVLILQEIGRTPFYWYIFYHILDFTLNLKKSNFVDEKKFSEKLRKIGFKVNVFKCRLPWDRIYYCQK